MSTMLVIPDEVTARGKRHEPWMRPIPWNAQWWRMRLFPGKDGHLVVMQCQIDHLPSWAETCGEKPDFSQLPYSIRYELFDNSEKWFFPYDYAFAVSQETLDIYSGGPYYGDRDYAKTITTSRKVYLDILTVTPPGPVANAGSARAARDKHVWVPYPYMPNGETRTHPNPPKNEVLSYLP